MNLNTKDFEILKLLIKFDRISIDKIVEIKGFSKQTIKISLNKINELLKENFSFSLKLDYPLVSFPLEKKDLIKNMTTVPKNSIEMCKNERIIYLILHFIFEKEINVLAISKELEVTVSTIIKDLVYVKSEFLKFNLKIESKPWKGSFIVGDDRDFLRFTIRFLMIYFINKFESPYVNNIYKNIVNPKVNEYLKTILTDELYSQIKKAIKDISNKADIKIIQFSYYSFIASILYIKAHKSFKCNPKIKDSEKAEKLLKIIRENTLIRNLNCSQSDLNVFIKILLGEADLENLDSIYDEINNLLNQIEIVINIKFTEKEKIYLINLFFKAHFEEDFLVLKPISYFIEKPDYFKEIEEKLVNKIMSTFPNIYSETLFQILFFLKNIYLKALEKENKKVLIIDSSYNNFLGALLKEEILCKYFVNEVNVKHFLEELDYTLINQKYHFVIFLDTYTDTKEKFLIPTQTLSFSSFLQLDLNHMILKKRYH